MPVPEKRSLAKQKPARRKRAVGRAEGRAARPDRGARFERPAVAEASVRRHIGPDAPERGHEVLGTLALGAGAALGMALVSWRAGDAGANWVGPAGYAVAGGLLAALGVAAHTGALVTIAFAVALFRRAVRLRPLVAVAWACVVLSASVVAELTMSPEGWSYPPGGAVGRALGGAVRALFGTAGSLVLVGTVGVAAMVVATGLSVLRVAGAAAQLGKLAGRSALAIVAPKEREEEEDVAQPSESALSVASAMVEELLAGEDARIPTPSFEGPKIELPEGARKRGASERRGTMSLGQGTPTLDRSGDGARDTAPDVAPDRAGKKTRPPPFADEAPRAAPEPPPPPPEAVAEPAIVVPRPPPPRRTMPPPEKAPEPAQENAKSWVLPPLTLLGDAQSQPRAIDRDALTRTAEKLTAKLADFGVDGRVVEIRPGPVVTMYEFAPGPGIKLSRIAGLADDLAMAMEAMRVRIVAPIPGKGVVGIEVPNRDRETVYYREILEQDVFQKSVSKLTMALGKDIEGMPYVVDLARMPHLLVAGTTGSGKSVSVNAMLLTMLFKATPDEVRFLMVDPKMLELSVYEGIPHLLLPVVTDPKKAALALRWAVEEMERRYQLLADAGVRNIQTYNKWIDGGAVARKSHTPKKVDVVDVGAPEEPAPAPEAKTPLRKLPYLVIIIDELADLMMVASREVETYIARLAQMARAAGIHLMVATQRPSTDVVTGVIKANFPARVSFQVASRHDSTTIINGPGAENLLGMGDMLILPPGTGNLTRVHGSYVSEDEIHKVVDHWKAQGAPKYDMDILKAREEENAGDDVEDELSDELYDQALAAVAEMRQVSISLLQRKMRIGYNRAARMIERMERDGIVGPADGAKPRDVLIRPVGEMPGV